MGSMSLYALTKICQVARSRDAGFIERLKTEPGVVLNEFRLTDQERSALMAGDVAWLYDRGVPGLLLAALARAGVFGLTMPIYLERITAAQPPVAVDSLDELR
jgi:hypothetical protein